VQEVQNAIESIQNNGKNVSAFIAEAIERVGGKSYIIQSDDGTRID